jgi:PAS domain S-box-containing protein
MSKTLIWKIAFITAGGVFFMITAVSSIFGVFELYLPAQVVVLILIVALVTTLFVVGAAHFLTLNVSEFTEQAILDNSQNGIFIALPGLKMGDVLYVNPAFAELFGTAPDILMCDEFLPEQYWADPGQRQMFLDVIRKEKQISGMEIGFKKKDGKTWWGKLTCHYLEAVSGPKIQGTLIDITEMKKSEAVLKNYNETLENEIHERTRERDEIQKVSILGLSKITEYRDPETGNHVIRMAHYSRLLSAALARTAKYRSYITSRYVDEIFISAPLHDIGKVGIEDSILKKPGKLTTEEFDAMKHHAIYGGDTLREIERMLTFRSFLTLGKEIAYNHHQKWTGGGYPDYPPEGGRPTLGMRGHRPLKGTEIPLSARIVALADVYDALSSNRCYRKAFTHEASKEIILKDRGTHFDPDVVDAFLAAEPEFINILREFKD